jgi:LacI family transcriptional regulator
MDNEAVGHAAAEHLAMPGRIGFGFIGPPSGFALTRRRAFEAGVKAACDRPVRWIAAGVGQDRLTAWLTRLPRPASILAANDEAGLRVLEAAHVAGLSVPADVAVLGVDNDELLCGLNEPGLSSIAVPAQRVGQEAAELLDRLIRGQAHGRPQLLLPPGPVVKRLSTDGTHVGSPLVQRALAYLQEHAAEPIGIQQAVHALGCSRRTLEQAMKAAIGRTPGQELTRLRLERAKALLVSTSQGLEKIARRCGYAGAVRLSVAFRRETGQTPGSYRLVHQRRIEAGDAEAGS